MSVNVRPYRRGGWEVDVRVLYRTADDDENGDGLQSRRRRPHSGGAKPVSASSLSTDQQSPPHHERRCRPYRCSPRGSWMVTHGRTGRSQAPS